MGGRADMLTDRQRRLIMLLMAARDWQTSEQLAERLGVSSKLVKQEVAAIRRVGASDCAIQSSTHGGYRLARLSDGLRHELVQEFDVHEGHHSITHGYAQLYVYLLCADAPLTAAQLAQRFLRSKASIADDLDVMRYRVRRMPNLAVVDDARLGVRVTGPEAERRYEMSKWLLDPVAEGIPFSEAARSALVRSMACLVPAVRRELASLAANGHISGEDAARAGRYAAVTVWRSRGGHRCAARAAAARDADVAGDDEPEGAARPDAERSVPGGSRGATGEYDELADRLAGAVARACGYYFDAAERAGLKQLLVDTVIPREPPVDAVREARRLTALVREELGARAAALVSEREAVLAGQLSTMAARVRAGHGALNYQASAAMARYPAEGCLAMRFLDAWPPFSTAKAEAARIALVLADALAPLRAPWRGVLFSDESLPVTQHIAEMLRRAFADVLASVDVLPVAAAWRAGDDAAVHDELSAACVFTTDAALVTVRADALVVPVLPATADLVALRPAVEEHIRALLDAGRAACWRDAIARDRDVARILELLGAFDASGAFVGPDEAGDAVLLTVVRTVVLVWRATARAADAGAPRAGAAVLWRCPTGVRLRGKRYDRVIELTLPPEGMGGAGTLFAQLQAVVANGLP